MLMGPDILQIKLRIRRDPAAAASQTHFSHDGDNEQLGDIDDERGDEQLSEGVNSAPSQPNVDAELYDHRADPSTSWAAYVAGCLLVRDLA